MLAGANRSPDPGEGADPAMNGSSDDDDLYTRRVARPWTDPDANVADQGRPIVHYQVTAAGNRLKAVKAVAAVRLDW